MTRRIGLAVTLGLFSIASLAGGDETEFRFGGYIKLDAIYSEYDGGTVASDSPLRDFHLPAAIPVGGPGEDEALDFHAKESRFNFKLTRQTGNHRLGAFLEMDFLLGLNGDERVSNSYNPRLRHAYLTYDNWLFGQTWSTFQIVVLPEDLDFIGVAEGTTFCRGPQIRFTRGPWQVSLENPETTVTPNGGGARIEPDDNTVPELVGRYDYKAEWGTLSTAGILRRLRLDDGSGARSDTGWGLSVGGKARLGGRDDLVFQATTGEGLGRHLALNAVNSATIDAAGDLDAVGSSAGFVGWRHWFSDRWRTNLNYSAFAADNELSDSGTEVTREASSVSINLLVSPVPELTFGVELMHAERRNEAGEEGDLDRLQFSAIYNFDFSTSGRRSES